MVNLRQIAQRDVKRILEGEASIELTITDPAGNAGTLRGWSNDIGFLIDPDTGQAVSGRHATIAVSMLSLREQGLANPTGIEDRDKKPWLVQVANEFGESFTFAVQASQPDRTMGNVTCDLVLVDV